MDTPRIIVQREDPFSETATKFLNALLSDLARRYPDRIDNEAGSFRPEDVTVPRSAFVLAWLNGEPVGSGAIRPIDETTVELKRMYVPERTRNLGVGGSIVRELERMALEFGYTYMVLETGVRQPEAIALYTRLGFGRMENFGEYVGNPLSVCMQKKLVKPPSMTGRLSI